MGQNNIDDIPGMTEGDGIENFEIRNLHPETPWFEGVARQSGAIVKCGK
jgi:hypothetical protein